LNITLNEFTLQLPSSKRGFLSHDKKRKEKKREEWMKNPHEGLGSDPEYNGIFRPPFPGK